MRPVARLLLLALVLGLLPAAASTASEPLPDLDEIDPVRFSYDEAIVERHLITGRDGLQTIAFDLIRPDTDEPVPTIMVSSPYYSTNGRYSYVDGRFQAARKTPWGSPHTVAEPTTPFPEQYDELFVPRGYAVLLHDLRGTRNSSGCQVYGHRSEAEDAVDVINWVAEQSWSNDAVAMIGGSYDGTIANGVATMAPEALKAIVPIRAIDRWYDYHHFNGVLSSNFVTPFSFAALDGLTDHQHSYDEDVLFGAHVVERKGCSALGLTVGAQYANPYSLTNSDFWASRDYVKDAENIEAAVFLVHGLNDTNVKPMNASHMWEAIPAGVPKKIWWLRGAHDNPHNPDLTFPVNAEFEEELHRFFLQFLKGVDSGWSRTPAVVVQDEDGVLMPATRWPAPSTDQALYLTPAGLSATEPASGAKISYSDNPATGGTVTLTSEPLEEDLRISGQAFLDLTYSLPNGGDTTFAYALNHADDGGRRVRTIASAYARGAFRAEIKPTGRSEITTPAPHAPGAAERITFPFWPADYVIPAGDTVQLVLDADDNLTLAGGNGTTEVHVGPSKLVIPDSASREAEAALAQQ